MTEAGKMYGGALYELAAEEGLDEAVLSQLEGVRFLFAEYPAYVKLLAMPSVPKTDRCAALDKAFRGQVEPYLLNFLKLLCEKGEIRALPDCAEEYRARYNQAHGILEATAVSAVPLTGRQAEALRAKLAALTGKTIALSSRVDPACLGGVRLEVGGTQLDGTVQNRLDALRRRLAATV